MTRHTIQRRRLTFNGRVQGVGFRATSSALARPFPISGWVRNEADGSVLMEVQGEGAAIDAFLSDLRARLSRFITQESSVSLPPAENETGFEVRY